MVVVDVQNDADGGGQMQEGLAVLAGLDDHALSLAGLAVAADEGQLAADDGGGILTGQFQHGGDHAGGGGLAVGARHAHTVRVHVAHIAQQHAALHRLDATGAGGFQLRVVVVDGRAVHHQLHIAKMGGIVANVHGHAQSALRLGDLGLLHIAAGDGQPAAVQNLNQRIGAGPAATDKMYCLHTVQQMGVETEYIRHRCHLNKNYPREGLPRRAI